MYTLECNLKLTKQQMHFQTITPQKMTRSHFLCCEEVLLKELSPLMPTIMGSHSKNAKLEMLNSPLPANRDLFSQLLGTERKAVPEDCFPYYQILEEESYENVDDLNPQDYMSEQESSQSEEGQEEEYDENGVKKRKRKSTAQIKALKQELEVEGNWSKEKIAEMSELTGLSQSQVYKWWWDQKKKNGKQEALSRLSHRRKPIRKEPRPQLNHAQHINKLANISQFEEDPVQTKAKQINTLEEVPETQRKVNKRLIFS